MQSRFCHIHPNSIQTVSQQGSVGNLHWQPVKVFDHHSAPIAGEAIGRRKLNKMITF
jgi:hypothetical protein